MPKKTKLTYCVKCDKAACIGVYLAYYALRRARQRKEGPAQKKRPATQIKGTLPARGYCMNCFLRLLRSRGLSPAEVLELEEDIENQRSRQ